MSIDAIGGSNPYTNIASGLKINSAADNAAGLSIVKGMDAQVVSSEKNLDNLANMSNALNTADGALASIGDSLGQIRDLAIAASNGVLSDDDKGAIQNQVKQLLSGIEEVAKNTEFNRRPLLDGSFTDINTGQNTDGSGKSVSIASSTLSELGLDGFDVSGDVDISKIDSALDKVNESRSNIGSASKTFEYASHSISGKINNITSSMSLIEDTDISQEISSMKKDQILDQYKYQMQAIRMQNQQGKIGGLADFKL